MNRRHVVNVVAVTLILGLWMSARAEAQSQQPDAAKPATTQPATQPATTTAPTSGKITCEVVEVEGSYLVVKLESGDLQVFNVNPERRFLVDGTPLTVGQLKPGTILTASYTSTPPVGATVTTVTGKVGPRWAAGYPDPSGRHQQSTTSPRSSSWSTASPRRCMTSAKEWSRPTGFRASGGGVPNDIEINGTTKK
jgi:hypothetical protein